ncbi:hypothetical protein DV096_08145 [Bradymonadaceae bacterium TMQ3]|uniref:PpiC domain-containing protein n=1 Tax=Lujinxingia sediminis TaxID=2480984 RepID=A0ABY0CT76_9DELT|nr:SurA N-terminal domain-containing protein [Lujinxingia sediminis]RDV38766.1 hypothetical protein DV096_08145 [Bradymonadaceae bacterium TMQ3]RVU44002.1 hypothetical protein EA187_10580 [Lujinxingia sediminis]TXC76461.1 hypothetical protein FRC91_06930 [Bradymonadales bacterium TMQ1]
MKHRVHNLSLKTLSLLLAVLLLGCDPGVSEPPTEISAEASGALSPGGADAPGAAAGVEASRVVARVNEVPIHAIEVERRLDRIDELYRHARRPFNPAIRQIKRNEVIDRLIDHELLRQHIDQAAVEISPKRIDLAVEERVDEHFGSTTAFQRYLKAENLSMSDFRRDVRDAMILEHTLLGDAIAKPTAEPAVSEAQLREIYARVAAGRPAAARVRVSSVTLPARHRQQVARISRAHCNTESLPEEAIHRDLGWRQRHQLPAAAGFRLFGQGDSPAQSAVVPAPDGSSVTVYCVHDRREAGVRDFDEVEPLLRERANRALLESKRRALLQRLREHAEIERVEDSAPGE